MRGLRCEGKANRDAYDLKRKQKKRKNRKSWNRLGWAGMKYILYSCLSHGYSLWLWHYSNYLGISVFVLAEARVDYFVSKVSSSSHHLYWYNFPKSEFPQSNLKSLESLVWNLPIDFPFRFSWKLPQILQNSCISSCRPNPSKSSEDISPVLLSVGWQASFSSQWALGSLQDLLPLTGMCFYESFFF